MVCEKGRERGLESERERERLRISSRLKIKTQEIQFCG